MNDGAGPRSGREPASAAFEVERVGPGRRGRQPAAILGFLAVLAAMVTIGVGGRTPPVATAGPEAAVATSAASVRVTPVPTSPVDATPLAGPTEPPIVVVVGDQVTLKVHRYPAGIFVHGDVFVPKTTWVFVSLEESSGRVGGWSSVSVPGGAGPAVDEGPTLRFDVDLAIPAGLRDSVLWVQATAYDDTGKVIGSARLGVLPDGSVVDDPRPIGAGPQT